MTDRLLPANGVETRIRAMAKTGHSKTMTQELHQADCRGGNHQGAEGCGMSCTIFYSTEMPNEQAQAFGTPPAKPARPTSHARETQ